MKKLFLAFFCGAILSFSKMQAIVILPEVKAAYFHPTDSRFRKIYGGGGIYTFEASIQFWNCLYPWFSVGGFWKSGRSIGEKDKTHVTIIPLGFGLKYFFRDLCCCCWSPYIGAGLAATYLHTDDNSPFVKRKNSNWGVGGIAKAGLLYYFCGCFFLDAFADYTYMEIDFDKVPKKFVIRHDADISGFSFGGGLGFSF